MEILLIKGASSNEHVLSCKRKDGSITWKHVSPFFIMHDICHYTVETIMPFHEAFFGMIKKGADITEFELPKEERSSSLTSEALLTEHLVNLLVIEYTQGKMDNLLEILRATYEIGDDKTIDWITEKKINEIRIAYYELMKKWNALPEREIMTLIFED
jgi:hypothetical protein